MVNIEFILEKKRQKMNLRQVGASGGTKQLLGLYYVKVSSGIRPVSNDTGGASLPSFALM